MLPCGTFLVSVASEPATYTKLHELLFDSLVDGLRGSIVATPSIEKAYRYAPGGTGAVVISHMPLAPFVSGAAAPLPGTSVALRRTVCACGARMRNVIRLSAVTSGDTTCGPAGGP